MSGEKRPEADPPVPFVPDDWRERPELLPALRLLVEGARRAALRKRQQG